MKNSRVFEGNHWPWKHIHSLMAPENKVLRRIWT